MTLPKRQSNRLKDYDYRHQGVYFVTICVRDRLNLFWQPLAAVSAITETPPLSTQGYIVERCIQEMPIHYSGMQINGYVIMPNHVHLLLTLAEGCKVSLSTMVNQLKGVVTRRLGRSIWQRSYHDHIVRDEQDYLRLTEYIMNNPLKWCDDQYYQ